MKVIYNDDFRNDSYIEVDGVKLSEMKLRKKGSVMKKILEKYSSDELIECVLLRYGKQLEPFKHELNL